MFIEYRIQFHKDGVTVTQRIEPDTPAMVRPSAATMPESPNQASKPASNSRTVAASLPESHPSTEGPKNADVHRASTQDRPEKGGGFGDKTDTGGGFGDKPDVGGGGPDSGMVIVFGPVIVGGRGAGDAGFGFHDKTDVGGQGGENKDAR